MELPEYEFFCHAQIVTELNRYNADAPIWLSKKIGAQKIKSYTDQEILESLSLVRGPLACATYTQMLKLACDAFSKDYFSEHYRALEEADYTAMSREDYLKELERLDIEVGKKNNLGEIKSFVLLQVLSVMLGEQIYVFCSDDKNARNVVNQGMQEKQSITVRCVDIEDLEKQAEAIRVEQIKLYESYADGVLLRDAYIEKKKALSEKLAALQDSIRTEKEEQECADELDEEIRALTKQASEKTYIGGLTKECVDAFVSMVYLYDDQTMKIEFNCEDVIRRALEKYGA